MLLFQNTEPMLMDFIVQDINSQRNEVYPVTENMPEMDTIKSNTFYGIPYATHTDSLLMYLEKAPKASWEICLG